jgi:phage terminase small subunit
MAKNKKLANSKKVPTLKQQEWLRQTVVTKNPTEAARMAYNVKDNHNASVIASENLTKPYLREALNEMLEQYNLTLEDTIREHKWVITQKKDISTKLKGIQI